MPEIPDEIMAKAREVADQIRRGMDRTARIEIIARVLMERDRRAAGIADMHDHRGDIGLAILTYGAKP